jgi:hypothetical protein
MTSEVLTTGWERGVPAGDTITRRFVLAYAERIAAMAARTGGRQKWVDGARMADLRSPFGYDNAVVVTRPLAEAEWPDLLAAAEASSRRSGGGWCSRSSRPRTWAPTASSASATRP